MMGLKGLFIQLALVAQLYTASAGTLGQDRLLITQETDYKLGLRTLALSGSDGYASFLQTIFGGYGHPVDVIKVSSAALRYNQARACEVGSNVSL
jgi:hypothetical protein